MIAPHDTAIVIPSDSPWKMWACYEHQVTFEAGKPPEVIMVGVTKMCDVYRMAECRLNSEWQRIFAKGGHVMVRIIATGDDKPEMMRWAATHMRSLDKIPRCNLHGVSTRGYARPIRCENTGEVFASQKEACDALGIHQSAMSRHLGGGLGKVNDMVFRYVSTVVD